MASLEPSMEEVEDLINHFSKVVELSMEDLREESKSWMASTVVVRSLGRRILTDLVARDFQSRTGIKGGVAGFSFKKEFALVHFKEARERDLVLHQPWVIIGQVFVMEPPRPSFFLMEGVIRSAFVWIQLPWLSMEFWERRHCGECFVW